MVIASYLIGDVVRYAHPINVLLKGQTHVKCQVRKIAKKNQTITLDQGENTENCRQLKPSNHRNDKLFKYIMQEVGKQSRLKTHISQIEACHFAQYDCIVMTFVRQRSEFVATKHFTQ
jgi:hypothetical protein